MYQPLDAILVRAPAWNPGSLGLLPPELTGPGATPAAWRGWLDLAWQVCEFADAVETASPDLARQVSRICSEGNVPDAAVRRAVLSVLRYLLRGTSRATPFGLLAGVAPARLGPRTVFRAGSGHRAVAKPDSTWLTGVTESLEADDGLRPLLTVVAGDLVTERDGYLVIAHQPGGSPGGAPQCVRVRATRPVRTALEAARSPVRVAVLAAKLAAVFPATASEQVDGLVAQLIRLGFLRTSLRAPMTTADPLTVLLAEFESVAPHSDARTRAVRAVSATLARHNAAPDADAARGERLAAAAMMRTLQPAVTDQVIGIDLLLDWDLVVPEAIAAEAASAAGVLARLARRPALSQGWVAWHARFLDRYGPGALVPVLDAVHDSRGLGFPAGYLGSPYPEQHGPLSGRDKTLLTLAHRAAVQRELEITLDDALIGELAVISADDPVQPSAEMTVRVHASSIRDLDQGRFTLHVTGVSRAAGTVTGRFLKLLGRADRDRVLGVYAAVPGAHRDSLLAHLSSPPLYVRSENVARAPQAAGLLISLGEHRAAGSACQVPVSDLAVTADASRLHLVSVSRGRPMHTQLPSAVDLTVHTHPLTRFLLEAPVALAAPCTAFDWGAASALPFLPALRHGRTVLSPARWTLTAADLPDREAPWPDWDRALAGWRDLVVLPSNVLAGDGDRCIALDLAQPSHRALLRAEIERTGRARLRVAPGPGDLGWAGGHSHEVTIPLAVPGPVTAPVRWRAEVTRRDCGHLPGCGGRLYLKLYGPRDLQDAILTRLPQLAERTVGEASWWFIRYEDPEPHLRLRINLGTGSAGEAAGQVGTWTSQLRDHGLVTRVNWDTYYPETARFGGDTAIETAEAFFAADSRAALTQVTATGRRNGPAPQALTAASMVDIVRSVIGSDAAAMRWLAEHARTVPVPPPRPVCDQAVALVCTPHPATALSAGDIERAWATRSAALAAYREALETGGTVSLTELLPDLMHLHHARVVGPSLESERACLHLARAAAFSWLARTRKKAL